MLCMYDIFLLHFYLKVSKRIKYSHIYQCQTLPGYHFHRNNSSFFVLWHLSLLSSTFLLSIYPFDCDRMRLFLRRFISVSSNSDAIFFFRLFVFYSSFFFHHRKFNFYCIQVNARMKIKSHGNSKENQKLYHIIIAFFAKNIWFFVFHRIISKKQHKNNRQMT